jgi:hypothetical protein
MINETTHSILITKRCFTLERKASPNDWFKQVNESLYDYRRISDDLKKELQNITDAFRKKTAQWTDEQISEEVEYLSDYFVSDIDEVQKIDIEDLKQEGIKYINEAAQTWKELRDGE